MKITKGKLNTRLIRKIQRHILEEPRRFFMTWFIALKRKGEKSFASDNGTTQRFGPCGTAACVAGWANLLTKGEDAADDTRAAEKLNIMNPKELRYAGYIGSHPLFDRQGWPEPFNSRYAEARTPKLRAKIASERLEHLIKTGE